MSQQKQLIAILITVVLGLSLVLNSCTDDPKDNKDPLKDGIAEDTNKIKDDGSVIIGVGDALFSIPSPFQTSMLIKDIGAGFDKSMLNSYKQVTNYTTNFQKALNLGVYGADLGYTTIFEQPQDAIKYFEAVEELANELGVSSAFDAKTIESIKNNIGDRDSLLTIVSKAYKASDEYLKNNARTDVSALILAGGWIESVYFIVSEAKKSPNQDVINRIGEQKNPLENLIKILTPYYDQPEYSELVDNLIELAFVFDGVQIKYHYAKPTVDVEKKITYINSTSDVEISEYQLEDISKRMEILRNLITGNTQNS